MGKDQKQELTSFLFFPTTEGQNENFSKNALPFPKHNAYPLLIL